MYFLENVLLNRLYTQKIWEDKKQESYFCNAMQFFFNTFATFSLQPVYRGFI